MTTSNGTPSLALSILDLSPVSSGSTSAQALRNTIDLAQVADRLGYTRYWLAEHHNSAGVASSTPEILIGHVAAMTSTIRVGSGGIMLPNHVPLHVVEQFRVLEALHPGRIDLGIGRAPGTDGLTALALRRSRDKLRADDFPAQLDELLAFSTGQFPAGHPFSAIQATPADVPLPPVWLLGSSDFSAQVAAQLGLGFSFAHHINPSGAIEAMRLYHQAFTPSRYLQEPQAILTVSAICADTPAEANDMAASLDLIYLRLRSGDFGPLPSPEEARAYPYTPEEQLQIMAFQARRIVGDPTTVSAQIRSLAEQTAVREVMITALIHSHAARVHSYELLASAFGLHPRQ